MSETADYGRTQAAELVKAGGDDPDLIVCPDCGGRKGGQAFVSGVRDGRRFCEQRFMPCSFCKGGGKVWSYNGIQYRTGRLLREERLAKGYTTRAVAQLYDRTMSAWSDLEQGRKSLVEIDDARKWLATQPARERPRTG